jgi:hypothetical protein
MHPTFDPDSTSLDANQRAQLCLARTRSHVLVAVGLTIAVSGWLLRARAQAWQPRQASSLSEVLYGALGVLTAASYVARRALPARVSPDGQGSNSRFYWSHVGPAAAAALAVPLGFAFGSLVAPRLDAIAPFWAVPFVIGFLCLPRQSELVARETTSPDEGPDSS